jgi:hypothetical protein
MLPESSTALRIPKERRRESSIQVLPTRSPVAVTGLEPRLLSGQEELRRCLRTGISLQLGSPDTTASASTYTRLVGFKLDRYLIIEQPATRTFPLREGQAVEVRCMAEGRMLVFVTEVVRSTPLPEPLTFLAYPEKVRAMSLRRFQRVKVSFPARLTVPGQSDVLKGKVVDVSLGGMGVRLDAPPEGLEAASVRLDVELPSGPFRFEGTVRRAQEGSGDACFVGVELSLGEGAEARRALLAQLVRERALELDSSDERD